MSGPRIPRATRCGPLFTLPTWSRWLMRQVRLAVLRARSEQLTRSIEDIELRRVIDPIDSRVLRGLLAEVKLEMSALEAQQ